MSRTKDEKYLLTLYEMTQESDETIFNRFEIGEKIGFSPRLTKTVLVGLMQANFIRKESKEEVSITKRGIQLAEELCS